MKANQTCIIYNPHAGRGRAKELINELGNLFEPDAQLLATQFPGHAIQLTKNAILTGATKIVAAGGDGTVHEVANGILLSGITETTLSVLPIGSANDYAYTLGMKSVWDQTQKMSRTTTQSHTETLLVDVGHIYSNTREKYYVNSLGIGFNGAVTLESRKIRFLRGMPLYLIAFLRAILFHYSFQPIRVQFDDEICSEPTLALTINLAMREGGFLVTPHAVLTDGLFDIMHAKKLHRLQLVRYLPSLITGNLPQNHPNITLRNSKLVKVQSELPLCIHADGEFFSTPTDNIKEVNIELLPARLRVEIFPPALYAGRSGV